MKFRTAWLLLALALLLPATAMAKQWKAHKAYDGADLPEDQIAHLKISQESDRRFLFSRRGLSVRSIDGKPVGNWWTNAKVVDELLFKPGKHRIGYMATNLNGGFAMLDLWFVAEPGKAYVSRTEATWYSVRMWIEDAKTGERVGGVVGSADEPVDAPAEAATPAPAEAPASDVTQASDQTT